MSNKRKRRYYDEQSILIWQKKDESNAHAKQSLDAEWRAGVHPTQKVKEEFTSL